MILVVRRHNLGILVSNAKARASPPRRGFAEIGPSSPPLRRPAVPWPGKVVVQGWDVSTEPLVVTLPE